MKQITPEEAKQYRKLNDIDLLYGMSLATAFTREKDPDSRWDIVTYYGDVRMGGFTDDQGDLVNPHYVYVLSNPSIPGILKIGYTERDPYQRLKEINTAPGVVIPWEIRWTYKCPSGRALEGEVHSHLEAMGLRPNKNREGFAIEVTEAIKIIEELGQKYQAK